MRIRFTWQPDEWHEAVRLATTSPRVHRDVPFMVYGVLGLMSLGGVGDLFHFLQGHQIGHAGGKTLMAGACTVAAGSGMVWLTRIKLGKRRRKRLPPPPDGEQQTVFQETGWNTSSTTSATLGTLQSWSDLQSARTGRRTLVVTGQANTFAAVPLRALSGDEAEHLQRLLARKLRPAGLDPLVRVPASL